MAELQFAIEGPGAIESAKAFLALPEVSGTYSFAEKNEQTDLLIPSVEANAAQEDSNWELTRCAT